MPDSLVVKFDKKKAETNEAIQQHAEQPIRTGNKIPVEKTGPDRKLRLFIDLFNGLAGDDKNDVQKKILIDELINAGHFTEQGKRNKLESGSGLAMASCCCSRKSLNL